MIRLDRPRGREWPVPRSAAAQRALAGPPSSSGIPNLSFIAMAAPTACYSCASSAPVDSKTIPRSRRTESLPRSLGRRRLRPGLHHLQTLPTSQTFIFKEFIKAGLEFLDIYLL